MPLRVAFDLDGTLADLEGALERQADTLFGSVPKAEDLPASTPSGPADALASVVANELPDSGAIKRELSARQQTQLWRVAVQTPDFWETLEEVEPGIVAKIAALADAHRWEVVFATKRPATAGATSQVQSQRWLQRHGFSCPSVVVVPGSRGKVASALNLDVVVDDRPENCLDVRIESTARAILVSREGANTEPPTGARLGIEVVRSVAEALALMTPTPPHAPIRPPRLVDRVKRLFGSDVAAIPDE